MTYTLRTEDLGTDPHFGNGRRYFRKTIVKPNEEKKGYLTSLLLYDGNGILKGDLLEYSRVPVFEGDRQSASLDIGAVKQIVPGVSRNYQSLAEVNGSDLELIADWIAKDRTHLGVVSTCPSTKADLGLIAIMKLIIKENLISLQEARRAA